MPPVPKRDDYSRLLRGEITASEYVAGIRIKDTEAKARLVERHRDVVAELERENERLRAERDGWTREWRAAAADEDQIGPPDYSEWHTARADAENEAAGMDAAEPPFDHVWLERRTCSPPERVSEEDKG